MGRLSSCSGLVKLQTDSPGGWGSQTAFAGIGILLKEARCGCRRSKPPIAAQPLRRNLTALILAQPSRPAKLCRRERAPPFLAAGRSAGVPALPAAFTPRRGAASGSGGPGRAGAGRTWVPARQKQEERGRREPVPSPSLLISPSPPYPSLLPPSLRARRPRRRRAPSSRAPAALLPAAPAQPPQVSAPQSAREAEPRGPASPPGRRCSLPFPWGIRVPGAFFLLFLCVCVCLFSPVPRKLAVTLGGGEEGVQRCKGEVRLHGAGSAEGLARGGLYWAAGVGTGSSCWSNISGAGPE